MTYGEIYDEIVLNCWPGVAAPPEDMPAFIRKRIQACQRMINRDYNFWFSIAVATISTVVASQSYSLPTDFKEIEKAWFSVDGQSYGTPALEQMEIDDHINRGWQMSDASAEYPTSMRVDGSLVYLYPIPSAIRTLNILYWKFLPLVDTTVTATFNAYEDDISIYCADAIIAFVTSRIKKMQDEWQSAESFRLDFVMEIEGAMQEDKARRQIPQTVAPYIGGDVNVGKL